MRESLVHKTTCLFTFVCLLLSVLPSCADSVDITPPSLHETDNSNITYEVSNSGMVDIKGYDAFAITWLPPQKLGQKTIPGQLYFANPAFLAPCFQDKVTEGDAQWVDDSKVSITVSFTQDSEQNNGGAISGPTIMFTVNLDDNSISAQESSSAGFDGERINLSEEEMVQIGITLADIIRGVEDYSS